MVTSSSLEWNKDKIQAFELLDGETDTSSHITAIAIEQSNTVDTPETTHLGNDQDDMV